jgi:hypothetical protein
MVHEIEKLDQTLRAEADELLWGKGLHSLLGEYGQVHVTGSYALRLMAWRDLDIYLVAERILIPDFFCLGGRIAELLIPARMSFRNELTARTEGLPQGLYWGIYLGNERAGAWKIDLWAINQEQFIVLDQFCKGVERRLTDSSRLKILQIKAQCWMKPGYRRTFSSRDIYDAVLAEGVNTLDAFASYLQRVKGCTLEA